MEAKFFKEFKYKYRHRKYKSVTIVLGDESCDLDSAVSAIGYAALMEYESRFQRNRFPGYRDPNPEIPRDIFIPMLDVRRDDIHIKTEFLHLWAKYTFDVADLLLKDDLPSLKKQVQRDPTTKIVLVNHHILSDDYKFLAPYVTTIVDHRPLQPNAKSLYGRNVKWIMKDTASCASIVIDEIKYFDDRVDNYPLFFRWYPALLNILRATIVYDTLNFSPALNHFTDLDRKMAEYLEEYIETENPQDHPSTWSRATKLKGMLEARADVSKCIAFDVLRKDAKRVGSIYFAHVPILLKDYMKKVDHLDAMPEVLEAYGCETLAMLCCYYPPVKIYEGVRKEFAVFSPDRKFVEELIEFLHTWTRPNFILTPKMDGEVENLHAFDVHNMAATREHFVVALNSFFDSKREIALEMKRNQDKSAGVEKHVKPERNGTAKLNETAKRNGSEKKRETTETPTTIGGAEIAAKKPPVAIMGRDPVARFGPIRSSFECDRENYVNSHRVKFVIELAETMKKGLILPNLTELRKIRGKQGTAAGTGMTEVVMAADESHALEKCMTVEVRKHKIEEEQETPEKAIEKLKTPAESQKAQESEIMKEQEPKIETKQKMTEVSKTVVEPQVMEVSELVEKQITGEDQKAVEVQKTVTEPLVVEELTKVEEQEPKIGEEKEMVEMSKTVVDPLTAILNIQRILGEQVTASDIKVASVLMSLASYKSDVLEGSTTVEIQEHKEEEQEIAKKAIEKLDTATEPQKVQESEIMKEQEPKIEIKQKMTEVLKTVVEPQMVEVSELVEKQIIREDQKMVELQKTVAEPLDVEESTVEQESTIGEEKEMVVVSKTVVEQHIVPELKAETEQNIGEEQTVVEVVKTVIESQMVEELKTVRNQEQKIEQQQGTQAEAQSLVRKCGQIIDQKREGEKQGSFGGETVVESVKAVKRELDIKVLDTLNFQKILGKPVTSADIKMMKVLMMLSADTSHVLEESTTVKVQEHNKEEEQETAEKAMNKLKTAIEPSTVKESKTVKEQELKTKNAQKMTDVLKTVVEPQMVEVSESLEKQIGEEQKTVEIQKTAAEPQVVEESATVEQKKEGMVEVSKTVVEPVTVIRNFRNIVGKQVTVKDTKMASVLMSLAASKSHVLEESTTVEVQEHYIEEEQKTPEKAIEKLKTPAESQKAQESEIMKEQEPKIETKQKMTEVSKTVVEPQVMEVSELVEKQITGEDQKAVEVQKTVTEPLVVEELTKVEEQEPKIGEEKEMVEMSKTVVDPLTAILNIQRILGEQVTASDIKVASVLMSLASYKSDVLEGSTTVEIQEHKEEEQEIAKKAIEKLDTATEPQKVQESEIMKEQEPKIEIKQKMTEVLKTVVEPQMVEVSELVEKQIIREDQKMVELQKTVAEPLDVEESTVEQESTIGEEKEMVVVSKTVVEQHIVPELKAEAEQNIGEEQTVVEVVKTVIESQMVEELKTVRNQEQKIEQQQGTQAEAQSLVRKCGQIIDQKREGEKQGSFGGETVVESVKAVKRELDIKVLDTLNFQKILGKPVTSADIKMMKVLMMLSADTSHVLEESTTVKVQEYKKEEEQETAEKAMEKLKTATEEQIVEESQKQEKHKIVEKQGVADDIEIVKVLEPVAESQILEEQKMKEKHNIAGEQKIEEERSKEDIEMEEILRLVSELDISGEKDKSERKLPKERLVAVAKEADSVFTRCSRMEKKVAAMRREAEREKNLAEQKEMEIEREMTMALKEEEADREKEKVREAMIARQTEMAIEMEITMALKEEEEELEKRKAREKELEEQEKASRAARLTEQDNSQDSKGDPEEFGSSGF